MTVQILIVDDEPLIAFEIEDAVMTAGYNVADIASTRADALHKIDSHSVIDAAILDANLKNESSQPVLEKLKERNIPCVVVSGYSRDQIGEWIDDVPLVKKPFLHNELVQAVASILTKEK